MVKFYNKRGTAEQWIKEGKYALNWTRLWRHDFVDNQVRLQLFALAYNLGNFLRRLALPKRAYLTKDSFVSARVLHGDPVNDLAVLKIETATPNFLPIAPLRSIKTGDRVFTIGFPVSSVLGKEAKYTEGVVSSLSGIEGASSLLQITVPVQPGNSGGPLVNEKGEVVGIITSSAAILPFIKESGTLPQNVNWAVKADYLRPLIELPKAEQKEFNREQLIEHVKKSTFCIETE